MAALVAAIHDFPCCVLQRRRSITNGISHATETRLTDEARRRGVSVDTLLSRFIDERAALTSSACAPRFAGPPSQQ